MRLIAIIGMLPTAWQPARPADLRSLYECHSSIKEAES